jgi:hypothetical protein
MEPAKLLNLPSKIFYANKTLKMPHKMSLFNKWSAESQISVKSQIKYSVLHYGALTGLLRPNLFPMCPGSQKEPPLFEASQISYLWN